MFSFHGIKVQSAESNRPLLLFVNKFFIETPYLLMGMVSLSLRPQYVDKVSNLRQCQILEKSAQSGVSPQFVFSIYSIQS
ncbi:MAG TPA: hypothetical protein DIW81_17760 [Planctomycetaceae bacterium]|nr:hypothetical protein [Rubinisphaera sp.]HCS53410.1 hypothetical protein [Planctomycetaceae bacterium]